MFGLAVGLVIGGVGGWIASGWMHRHSDQYEVIERTQDDAVPNFHEPGMHTVVHYVLQNDGHKIWATCDHTTVDHLDLNSSCGFRPLKSYACQPGKQVGDAAGPLSDLQCKDADGKNVYLYVSKKE